MSSSASRPQGGPEGTGTLPARRGLLLPFSFLPQTPSSSGEGGRRRRGMAGAGSRQFSLCRPPFPFFMAGASSLSPSPPPPPPTRRQTLRGLPCRCTLRENAPLEEKKFVSLTFSAGPLRAIFCALKTSGVSGEKSSSGYFFGGGGLELRWLRSRHIYFRPTSLPVSNILLFFFFSSAHSRLIKFLKAGGTIFANGG